MKKSNGLLCGYNTSFQKVAGLARMQHRTDIQEHAIRPFSKLSRRNWQIRISLAHLPSRLPRSASYILYPMLWGDNPDSIFCPAIFMVQWMGARPRSNQSSWSCYHFPDLCMQMGVSGNPSRLLLRSVSRKGRGVKYWKGKIYSAETGIAAKRSPSLWKWGVETRQGRGGGWDGKGRYLC